MPREIVSGWLAAVSRRPVTLVGSRAMPSCCSTVDGVVVDALADQRVALEDEDGEELLLPAASGGRQAAERTGVRAASDRLHQHGVVGRVQLDDLDLLIREGPVELLPVGHHLLGAVVDLVGRDVLVARVLEGREGGLVVGGVLGLDVLADELLAPGRLGLENGHRSTL